MCAATVKDMSIEELESLISVTVKKAVGKLLEDVLDLKAIEERKGEAEEDYETYRSQRRKTRRHV
ncbi:MAG: hypothetical protein HY880_08690 [Deltaproteobacteria bacterium]|nr:hypothetical protein [Deltaproteobacteria bacterium]